MRNPSRLLVLGASLILAASSLFAQSTTGTLDLSARVTPTGARPEPVRQFTLYVLTKSYADIIKEVEGQDALPTQEQFIDKLTCSSELKAWMKAHKIIDLTSPDLDQLVTADDIVKVPEFFDAYERSNSGGVTQGLPRPKYRESDKQSNPDRYHKQREEYLSATRKFIESNPHTIQGMEIELNGVNPRPAWDKLHGDHWRRVAQLAPDTAQVKYLAGRTETDLEGRAVISGLATGNYWVSSLGMLAVSGDRRLLWDVPVKVTAGQTTHLELSNLNASEPRAFSAQ